MSRKSIYFTVPAAAVAATAGAGSANAAMMFQEYDYSVADFLGNSYDITIGSNPQNQYTFSKFNLNTGLIARDDGISGVNNTNTPTIGLASETYNNFAFTSGSGLSYYHLRFNLNGTTTYGYATVNNALRFARVDYEVLGSAVPEPATWALSILGFGLAGAAMRRRQGALATA